jgi:RNA polymerase sigma factor (sigma-70 family)
VSEEKTSTLLGTLAELRGFVLEEERQRLGSPVRSDAAPEPLEDLFAHTTEYEQDVSEAELEHLHDMRVQVAFLTLSHLPDDAVRELSTSTELPVTEVEAARDLAADALRQGDRARQRADMLFEQLTTSDDDDGEDMEVNNLLGHLRKIGRWPGDPTAPLVREYRLALSSAVLRHARYAAWEAKKARGRLSAQTMLAALDGLREALERFDPTRGFRLTTYAQWWIRHRLRRDAANHARDVRAPVYFWEDRARLRREIQGEVARTGEVPPLEKLRTLEGLSGRINVDRVVRLGMFPLRDAWMSIGSEETPAERLVDLECPTPQRTQLRGVLRRLLEKELQGLKAREQDILLRRFGLEGRPRETLREIGETQNVSRERIRQLESLALSSLGQRVGARLHEEIQRLEPLP